MARRLILDTCVLIASERGTVELEKLVGDEDDVALAAISVAELYLGIELADDRRRPARESFVADIVNAVPVEDYTLDVARAHARILAATRRAGRPRGAHDMIIAATAAARNRSVVTADRAAHFAGLPDVDVLELG